MMVMQSGLIAASHSSVGKAPYYRFRGSGLESMSGPSLFQKYHFYHFIIAASSLRLVIFSTANDDYVTITQVYSYRHNLISTSKPISNGGLILDWWPYLPAVTLMSEALIPTYL